MTARRTVAFSKNSSNLFFHILTKCNLRCRHCYIHPKKQGEKNYPQEQVSVFGCQVSELEGLKPEH